MTDYPFTNVMHFIMAEGFGGSKDILYNGLFFHAKSNIDEEQFKKAFDIVFPYYKCHLASRYFWWISNKDRQDPYYQLAKDSKCNSGISHEKFFCYVTLAWYTNSSPPVIAGYSYDELRLYFDIINEAAVLAAEEIENGN